MDAPPECSGHSHDHQDHASDDLGLSLRPLIDFPGVVCQNEDVLGMGKAVLKLYEERCTELPSLRSPEDDPELLLHIPFTESVTVHSITVRSVSNNNTNNNNSSSSHRAAAAAPRRLKLFVNRDVLDFEMAREAPSDATLQLLPPEHYAEGTIDYPMRPAGRFQNISSLQLFFVDNYSMPTAQHEDGGEHSNQDGNEDNDDREEDIAATEITYIGLKGQGTRMRRVAVETVYESQGMPEDHKTPGNEFGAGHFVG